MKGKQIKVLDKGFVELVDWMGGDEAVVRAARVSHKSKGDKAADEKLIHSLMKSGHLSPFEHAVVTFHMKAPIFVARHFVRHRITSWNEVSRRYTVSDGEYYVPPNATEEMRKAMGNTLNVYKAVMKSGVRREVARIILPQSMYTEWYWTMNVRSLMNILNLRAHPAAQKETQAYAVAMAKLWSDVMPISYKAYLKYNAPENTVLKGGDEE